MKQIFLSYFSVAGIIGFCVMAISKNNNNKMQEIKDPFYYYFFHLSQREEEREKIKVTIQSIRLFLFYNYNTRGAGSFPSPFLPPKTLLTTPFFLLFCFGFNPSPRKRYKCKHTCADALLLARDILRR